MALKRYYRPEDISVEHAYEAALNEVFSSDETLDVGLDELEGRCSVLQEPDATGLSTHTAKPAAMLNFRLEGNNCSLGVKSIYKHT